jgi:hypothetical protein
MRNEAESSRALELYTDTVRRICFIRLKNHSKTEDMFQEVFLKYLLQSRFEEILEKPDDSDNTIPAQEKGNALKMRFVNVVLQKLQFVVCNLFLSL